MTFARFGTFGVLAGLAALAGLLFLLHRLRVRHREHEVVTTMFWREAVEDVRARVLMRRFRHPWAYALMCAIAAALWLGVAGPSIDTGESRDHVVLLDASAGMGWGGPGGRFDEAREAAEELVRSLPRRRTRVVLCGALPETLLLPGEDDVLLAARLRDAVPEMCPPTTAAVARSIVTGPRYGPVTVHVIGDLPDEAPVRSDAVVRVITVEAADSGNAGITALGVTPPRSGRAGHADVFVETASDAGAAPAAELTVGGGSDARPAGNSPVELASPNTATRRVLHLDVPTEGGAVFARLGGADALAADDVASALLPAATRIRVRVAVGLRAVIEPVVAAAPDLVLVDGDADVVVVRGDGEVAAEGDAAAVLRVVAPGDGHAVQVTFVAGRSATAALDGVVSALALDAIDATGLAHRSGRVVSVAVEPGARRGLALWDDFLRAGGALHGARTFPVFVAGAVRWLAARPSAPAYVAAGERAPTVHRALVGSDGAVHDPLGGAVTLPRADIYTDADGNRVVAGLSSAFVTTIGAVGPATGQPVPASGRSTGLVTLLGLLAFVLLGGEWLAHRTGRMP